MLLTESDLQRMEENIIQFGCVFSGDAEKLIAIARKVNEDNQQSKEDNSA